MTGPSLSPRLAPSIVYSTQRVACQGGTGNPLQDQSQTSGVTGLIVEEGLPQKVSSTGDSLWGTASQDLHQERRPSVWHPREALGYRWPLREKELAIIPWFTAYVKQLQSVESGVYL